MSLTINQWIKEAHDLAISKGFHDQAYKEWMDSGTLHPRIKLSAIMLMVSELAEAAEEVRSGRPPVYKHDDKPEGEAVELADCLLRIFDYAGLMGYDLEAVLKAKHEYNKNRPFLHGKLL